MGEVYAGRYELVDHLGGGGSGAVWRAWDHRNRRYLAVKLLRQRDTEAMMRFVREQSLRVAHPHVLPPTGFAADDDVVLLTMDLMTGGPLSALIADTGPLPTPYAVLLLGQLLDALVDVHAANLVHRDVKPANILLDAVGAGRPLLRLADFGIAVSVGEPRLTELGTVIGTLAYLAPEAAHRAEPHPRQDLYAAGAVGWFLLQGKHPRSDVPASVDTLPGHLPPPLRAVWGRLLARDPAQRYAVAAQARADLTAAVWASGLSAAVESIGTSAAPPDLARIRIPDRLGPLPPGWTPDGPDASGDHPPIGVSRTRRPAFEFEVPTEPAPSRPAPATAGDATTVPSGSATTVASGPGPTKVESGSAPTKVEPGATIAPEPGPTRVEPTLPATRRAPAAPYATPWTPPHPTGWAPPSAQPSGPPAGTPWPPPAAGAGPRTGVRMGTVVRLGLAAVFLALALVLFALALAGS